MKHILTVDDNKSNLVSAKSALSGLYKVTAVTSGEQALRFLENNCPDLILLDINMPEMDGFEVMEKIKANESRCHIPVIFLTADNSAETESRCLEEGAIDFIAKPFVPKVMLSRISRTLELEELRKSLAERLEQKIQEVSDIKNKSQQDALTGLWNRAYTEGAVDEILSGGGTGAVFMIDMDNFKAINDNYGHLAGDNVLKMFADTMRKYAGDGDILCRIGGDEFVTFVNGTTAKAELGNHAADIIADICHHLDECKFDTNSSVSIGISQYPDDGENFNALYNAADKALYHVKLNGKNSYHFFSERRDEEQTRSSLTIDLNYLRECMHRADGGKGAYMMDYDNFHHVYNFIRRCVDRSSRDVQTLLFTIADDNQTIETSELETAVEALEQAIYTSLRRVDVSTRYSNRQILVILLDANTENGDVVAKRIIDVFRKIYLGKIDVGYDIVAMDKSKGLQYLVSK